MAESIGNIGYNETASFIEKLANDIKNQTNGDLAKGRKELASKLYVIAGKFYEAKEQMDLVWKICKFYIKK